MCVKLALWLHFRCNLDPADLDVILTIYKYDTSRYYVNVYDTGTQRLCDLGCHKSH